MAGRQTVNVMTEGNYRKQLLLLMVPIFIGRLFMQLYNTADSVIVGRYVSAQALAAVSSVGSITYLFVGIFNGFSIGAGVIIARLIGAEDRERSQRAVHTIVTLGLLISVIMTVVGYGATDWLLTITGVPESVFHDASVYLKIYFLGSFFLIMYNIFVAILQAAGDATHPLVYLVASSLINIVLDVIFITQFGMGVDGAALATVISEALSMVLSMVRLMRADDIIRLRLNRLKMNMDDLKEIVRYGVPTAVQSSVIDLANMMIQAYINSFGDLAMAGVGAYSKIEGFAFLPVVSFSMAMSTFVSQNLGAGKMDRVRKGIRFGQWGIILSNLALGALLWVFAAQSIRLFSSDEEIVAYGVSRAKICAPFFFLLGYSHVSSAIMRGLGRPNVPMFVMLFCWCAVRVILIQLFGEQYHFIEFVFYLYPLTWTLSSVVFFFETRKTIRMRERQIGA